MEGALLALEQIPNLEIQLYGQQEKLDPYLKMHDRLTVIHCEEVVEGTDDPARAVRRKKDSSMARMMDAVEEGKADACLSAGNTGALMAGGLFKVGRIEGIARPALATTLPTLDGKGFLMLDLGANARCPTRTFTAICDYG
ncbi:Phosphate acyltransferase OS=Lysinibacillus sphaericus OX=1421 GN=plsX PE=3 SV=1 [Lysinibacillus sphaericus]